MRAVFHFAHFTAQGIMMESVSGCGHRVVKTGFCRKISMQTGSSDTLIGWKSGQTTFVPLWDQMEGSWLWTQYVRRAYFLVHTRTSEVHTLPCSAYLKILLQYCGRLSVFFSN
jgi:hypothetical protein